MRYKCYTVFLRGPLGTVTAFLRLSFGSFETVPQTSLKKCRSAADTCEWQRPATCPQPEGPLSAPDGLRTAPPPALGSVPVAVVRSQGGTRPWERPPLPSRSRGGSGGNRHLLRAGAGGRQVPAGRGGRAAAPGPASALCVCVCERRAARPLPPLGVCPAPVLRDRAGRRRRRSVGAGNFLVRRRRNNAAPQPAGRELPPSAAGRCEGGAPLGPPLPPEPPALPPPLSPPLSPLIPAPPCRTRSPCRNSCPRPMRITSHLLPPTSPPGWPSAGTRWRPSRR